MNPAGRRPRGRHAQRPAPSPTPTRGRAGWAAGSAPAGRSCGWPRRSRRAGRCRARTRRTGSVAGGPPGRAGPAPAGRSRTASPAGYGLERVPGHAVDAHADLVVQRRLLGKPTSRSGSTSSTPKSICVRALGGRHGQPRTGTAACESQQIAVVQVGEHVTVHHQELLGQPVLEAEQRADRGQWMVLLDVVDSQAPAGAVADERPDQRAEMVDRQGHRGEPARGQLLRTISQDRVAVADRHQGLRQRRGVRPQPHPLPPARITACNRTSP